VSQPLLIAVAEDQDDTREYFQELLPRLGHRVVAVRDGRQLVEACRSSPPDLIIADVKMPNMDGIEAAVAVNRERPIPVVIVSAFHEAELLQRAGESPVMAYLIKPVKQASVEAAIATALSRFGELRDARQEADSLRQALEDRKVIERAKGAVMKRIGVDERGAYRRMRRLSSHENHKLVEIARSILSAEDVFRTLEELEAGAESDV
jgi:two-component system, response regulator PdtaR